MFARTLTSAVVMIAASFVHADTIDVCLDGGDYPTIQEGIDAAVDGDEVIVCDGIYRGTGNRDLDYGGRLITVKSEGGGASSCIIDCEGAPNDPHRGFWFHTNETAAAVLEGFTIMNGDGRYNGGGILCESASPTIRNCTLEANRALAIDTENTGLGGGLCLISSISLVESCMFKGNIAMGADAVETGRGGGISLIDSNAEVLNCTFVENTAVSGGRGTSGNGGGLINNGGRAEVRGCTFLGNNAVRAGGNGGNGGGLSVIEADIIDCLFVENHANWFGGGLFVGIGGSATISGSDFFHNRTDHAGGGVNIYRADAQVDACKFVGNESDNNAGGVHTLRLSGGDLGTLSNALVVGNVADNGSGGIGHGAGTYHVVNSTVVGNWGGRGGIHNAAFFRPCNLDVDNTIAWGNIPLQIETNERAITTVGYSCVEGGHAGHGNIEDEPLWYPTYSGTWTVGGVYEEFQTKFTDMDGGWQPGELEGKILWADTDPIPGISDDYLYAFIKANTATEVTVWGNFAAMGMAGDDYQIMDFHVLSGPGSVDAGDNTAVPEGIEFDLDGNPRFVDDPNTEDTGRCGEPCDGRIVDMGAYEVQGGGCVRDPEWQCDGDTDGDGQVNPVDAGLVQAAFGSADGQDLCNYDVDCDGQINPVDAGIVQSLFGTCEAPRDGCP